MRWQILIPVASIISTCLAFSVAWWSSQRRKERESYYRFELSRLMLERYADGHERVMAWLGEQQATDARRWRDAIRLSAWVLLIGGIAALVALRSNATEDSLFGWVPIGIAAGEFLYLFFGRSRVGGVSAPDPRNPALNREAEGGEIRELPDAVDRVSPMQSTRPSDADAKT